MNYQNFLIEFANTIEVNPEVLTPEFNIKLGSAWDSLAFISTIALVDKYYSIILDSDALESLTYFSELLQLLQKKVA